MWLYYAFTSVVVLFLCVIHNPLHVDATLNLALISDMEKVCAKLALQSSGARRVRDVTREMGNAALEVIKLRAKKRAARAEEERGVLEQPRQKRSRIIQEEASISLGEDNSTFSDFQNSRHIHDEPDSEEQTHRSIPSKFSWEEWDSWLHESFSPASPGAE